MTAGDACETDLLYGIAEIAGASAAPPVAAGLAAKARISPMAIEREHGGQRDAVDRPPPGGEAASVGAREAHDASRTAMSDKARRRRAKASPRASKSRNWSKEAQAGDSSTTGAGVCEARASAAASCTARSSVPASSYGHAAPQRLCEIPAPLRRSDRPCGCAGTTARASRCRLLSACRRQSRKCRGNRPAPAPPHRHWSP